ncbi:hypothetical protein H633G_10079 [Metarhizium anisopliae BRIP 53284]|nr:hypothetical protein H633G_10079 [Metarhizium anisopliae BRIP 53284]
MTADDRRGLGIQGWRKEKQSYDKASTPDIGDRWLETQPQHGNRAFHPVGELEKAIIVTTSIEQTTSPSTGSMATSGVQTDIKAMRPTTPHDNSSALPSLDLSTSDLLFGSHDEVGDASGQINGSALLFELLTVPTTRRNEHLVVDSDKNRELNISSAIKDVQKIVSGDIFPGMSLEWRMPDAADGSQGTGLAINLNPSSCNTADETGWVKIVMIAVNPLVSFKQIGQFTAQIMSSFWSTRVVPNSRHEEPRIGLGKREKAREIQEDDLKITRDRTLGRGLMDDKCWVQKEGDLKRTDLQ